MHLSSAGPWHHSKGYEVPVECSYELYPWAKDVLFPTLKKFGFELSGMEKLLRRSSHARAVNLYSGYASTLESLIATLKIPSQDRTDFMSADSKKMYDRLITTMQKIAGLLNNVTNTVGPIDITELNGMISNYHEEYEIMAKGIMFLKQNTITKTITNVPVPHKFKGWIDVRPYCNAELSADEQMTIHAENTTYKRKGKKYKQDMEVDKPIR